MAQWNRLIEAPPDAVWAVLSDGRSYARFVVGTHESWEQDGQWPVAGAELGYTLKLGPWSYQGRTVSRVCEPVHRLELEARTHLGSARIAFRIEPWGDGTLVVVDEHPLQGPAARWHNSGADALLRWRHRKMLDRLDRVAVSTRDRAHGRA
ncbi:SRPBCC family protein [Streptomyces sp. NK15101]|uniref:SRPBCC family protein n=1 Tax=Streptomyces sp. NK15101 TaxID=2873261 RepID=UPI001CECA8DC|nr:SRPBCC family protein [Streptomyces sp. NK15101]